MPTAQEIKQRIEAAIPGANAEVEDYTGGGDHFRAAVTAPAFAGLSRIAQHRLVYDVFGAEVGGAIHALSLKTETPSSANAASSQAPGARSEAAGAPSQAAGAPSQAEAASPADAVPARTPAS